MSIDGDRQASSAGHGIPRVGGEVYDELFELARICHDGEGFVLPLQIQLDVLADQLMQQPAELLHDIAQVSGPRLRRLTATEGEQLAG